MNDKIFKKALLVFAGLLIFSFAVLSSASDDKKNIFNDKDQDGLSDEEEKNYGTDPDKKDTDGDGYSDGAEVLGGYDPLKPAPGDKIETEDSGNTDESDENSDTEKSEESNSSADEDKKDEPADSSVEKGSVNLTQELSTKLAGLIGSGSGENGEISISDLDSLLRGTISSELSFDDLPEIDEKEIKIKKQNYKNLSDDDRKEKEKRDTTEYLTALSYVAISNSPKKITSLKDIDALSEEFMQQASMLSESLSNVSYFKDMAEKGKTAYDQLIETEVPENMLDTHERGLRLFKYAISLKDKVNPDDSDPVRTISELSKIQSLLVLSMDFAQEVEGKFKEIGISGTPFNF